MSRLRDLVLALLLVLWTELQLTNGFVCAPASPPYTSIRRPIVAPLYSKSKSSVEEKFIQDTLLQKPLFSDLRASKLSALVQAFEKITPAINHTIVEQGDSAIGDYVYMIADGECTVIVDGEIVPEPYGIMGEGEIFGDMAVLYNETRSATIKAKSETVTLFRVYSETFKDILRKSDEETETMQAIDEVINQVAGSITLYSGNIIPPYKPERTWLWRRWTGTILNVSYGPVLLNMLLCLLFVEYANQVVSGTTDVTEWNLSLSLAAKVPDKSHPLVVQLSLIHEIWTYLQGLTTFILTFFLNEAFSFWRGVYGHGRAIQGRMNDHHLIVASHVVRNEDGSLTPESEQLLDDIGQFSRLFHALMWSSVAARFQILQTPQGLKRLATRGLITPRQLEVLQKLNLPENKLYYAPLEWMMIRVKKAMDKEILDSDNATKGRLIDQITKLRAAHGDIQDKLDARMPLAYSHLVQLLVDTFVLMAPFALYSDLGDYSIFAVGILTLFYTGLLNLAKIFLDPLNNEEFCRNSIFMDLGVFIRESNANSMYWKYSGEELPFDTE